MTASICIPHSPLPTPHSESPRRKGKIARLPKATRDMINRMLDDNLPYHVIIDELGEAGEGLNAQNITNWVQGGYQDYLKHQAAIDRVRIEMEFATDLLKETENADPTLIHRATNLIAATQLFEAVRKHGDEALKNLLQSNPAKYLSMLTTIATMANAGVNLENYRLRAEARAQLSASSQIKPDQGSVVEVRFQRAGEGGFQPPVPSAPASTQIKANQGSAQNIAPLTPPESAANDSEFKVQSSTFEVQGSPAQPELAPSTQIKPDQGSSPIVAAATPAAGEGGILPPVPSLPSSTHFKANQACAVSNTNTTPCDNLSNSQLSTLNSQLDQTSRELTATVPPPAAAEAASSEFKVQSSTFEVQGFQPEPELPPSIQIKPVQGSPAQPDIVQRPV